MASQDEGRDEYDPWNDDAPGPEEETLDQAWEALDAGDAEKALTLLQDVDADWPDRWIPESLALSELGQLPRARQLLDRVREMADVAQHPDFLWAEGQLLLREWRIDEARTALETLAQVEPSAAVFERLSLCAELRGDFEGGDTLLARSVELAGPEATLPPRFSNDEFEALVASAVRELPEPFRVPLETTEILVEPVPAAWMIAAGEVAETPPDLLGLFVGHNELERSGDESGHLPRRIFLFQRNLERATRTRAELTQEVRITIFHEIGHMLGFDEEGVAAMGLE